LRSRLFDEIAFASEIKPLIALGEQQQTAADENLDETDFINNCESLKEEIKSTRKLNHLLHSAYVVMSSN